MKEFLSGNHNLPHFYTSHKANTMIDCKCNQLPNLGTVTGWSSGVIKAVRDGSCERSRCLVGNSDLKCLFRNQFIPLNQQRHNEIREPFGPLH
uniref:Uncharacterized protein n=1 Tax=Ascaris lumbricoides TaxID=6252 RepID=A0A0M3HRA3_ASCLU